VLSSKKQLEGQLEELKEELMSARQEISALEEQITVNHEIVAKLTKADKENKVSNRN
jgi:predicted nuclease with TOPRIM domain